MASPLPPEIRVELIRHGTRYVLPRRQTGQLKAVGCVAVAFGVLFGGFAVFWTVMALVITQKSAFSIGGVLFALFGIPFILAGLFIIGFGVISMIGHCEIESEGGELRARERGGPFHWTRRFKPGAIRRFMASSGAARINDQPVTSGPLSDVGTLMAEMDDGKPRFIVLGYPRALVEALASELSTKLGKETGVPLEATKVFGPGESTAEALVNEERREPPTGTNIRVMPQGDAILATLPPTGFKGQARFLLIFSIFWLLLSSVVLAAFTVAGLSDSVKGDKPPWFIFVFLAGFEAIGIGMLLGAINLARRKASLRASPTDLMIVRQSPFGSKTFKSTRAEITSIQVGPSGLTVNAVPVMELQVIAAGGTKHGFFTGRTNEELAWLATELRRAMNVPLAEGGSGAPPKLGERP